MKTLSPEDQKLFNQLKARGDTDGILKLGYILGTQSQLEKQLEELKK